MHEVSLWEQKLEREAHGTSSQRDSKVYMNGVSQIPTIKSLRDDERNERRSPSSSPPPPSPLGEPTPDFSENNLLPCHYFDFIYGTSTGGLIATMLGRLRMSVPQCLEIYRDVGDDLFGTRRSYLPLATKYHHKPLEVAVQDIVRTHCKNHSISDCDGQDWNPWDLDIKPNPGNEFDNFNMCQSICLTAVNNGKIDEAHLLRTYNHRYNNIPNWITPYNEGADKLRIWQVTRATSAAPFYFKNLEADLEGQSWTFKDGGIRENNPAGAAWSEYVSLHGEGQDPAMLLSIGTGRPDESQDGFSSAWPGPLGKHSFIKKTAEKFAVIKNVLVKYTEGEKTHKDMLRVAKGEYNWYKRLNVSEGLENLPLDNWKKGSWIDPTDGATKTVPGGATLTKMEKETGRYLKRDIDMAYDTYAPPKTMLVQMAEKMVRQRRARQQAARLSPAAAKRWDTFMGRYLTGEYTSKADEPVFEPMKPEKTEEEVEAGCCVPSRTKPKRAKPTSIGAKHAAM